MGGGHNCGNYCTHMLIVAGKKVAQCSIPTGPPVLTVVVHLAKRVAGVRGDREGVEDALLLHQAGAKADALAGVLLAQAPYRMDCRLL